MPRPYTQKRYESNKRYDDKTYRKFTMKLRRLDDADIIEDIERCKAQGIGITEYVRRLYHYKNGE